jgi:tRNA(Ile)-lysidine synthase
VAAYAEQHGMNLEAAGHRLRHEFFRKQAEANGCDKIALGHTATDVAETLMMNLLRGAGIEGLAAIAPVRDRLIRPLVYLTREQTGQFCLARGLQFRTDCSNLDAKSSRRNHIRLHLMPLLEQNYGPGVQQALLRAALAVGDELEWTEEYVRQALERCRMPSDGPLCFSVEAAAALPPGLLHRMLRTALAESGAKIRRFQWEHWHGMSNLIYGESGSGQVDLPGGRLARREYDRFLVEMAREERQQPAPPDGIRLQVPGETKLPDRRCVSIVRVDGVPDSFPGPREPCAVMDADAVGTEMYLRAVKPGDRLVPLGMTGAKKVSDFFTDEKVPARCRGGTMAVVDADDRLLWLVGHRLSQLVAVGRHTRQHYRVRLVGSTDEAARK